MVRILFSLLKIFPHPPKYMDIKIFSVPKHVMASIIINAYLKNDTDNLDINKKVKEKLANCINTAARNRFGLI